MLQDQMSMNGISSSSPFFPPNFLLQNTATTAAHDQQEDHHHHHHHHHHNTPNPLSSLLPSHPQDYRGGMAAMLGKRSVSFSGLDACEDMVGPAAGEEDTSDDCSQAGGEKKRRLSAEQVRTLEKSFEIGNKLEPERKMQLARDLGLQPRQVAIWFQNRRARWKNKQLEKDYDVLKRHLDAARAENQALSAHNKKLQAQISSLKGRDTPELINLNKETEGSFSNRSENSSEINLDVSRGPATESPLNPPLRSIPFFPAAARPPTMVQLLQGTTKVDHDDGGPDENFGNFLCSMDDQSAFWPWADPHSFH